MKIFQYARTSSMIDDPGNVLSHGAASGLFNNRCPFPSDNPAIVAALESAGTMPVAGSKWPLSPIQVVVGVGALVVGTIGTLATALGSGGTRVIGVVILGVALLLLMIAVISTAQRRRNVSVLGTAWRQGWVRFAPARVGGVWINRVVHHNPHQDRLNYHRNYYYRAAVQVFPTDGSQPFTFTSTEFEAIASWEGMPVDLNQAYGPLDVFEPEFFNGWTICRYIAGQPNSATITTDLSRRQIAAALAAAGVR